MLSGAAAGLLATAPMTFTMLALDKILPGHEMLFPPEQLVNRVMGKSGPVRHAIHPFKWDGMDTVAHFLYGAGTGSFYGWLSSKIRWSPVLSGLLYGATVWLVSYLGWIPLVGLLPPATRQSVRRNFLMLTAHLVWGASLGWLNSRFSAKPKSAQV